MREPPAKEEAALILVAVALSYRVIRRCATAVRWLLSVIDITSSFKDWRINVIKDHFFIIAYFFRLSNAW